MGTTENLEGGFGELLRDVRQARSLTREDLAEATHGNVNVGTIFNAEQGIRIPRPETVHRLANALGLAGEERQVFISAANRARERRSDHLGQGLSEVAWDEQDRGSRAQIPRTAPAPL